MDLIVLSFGSYWIRASATRPSGRAVGLACFIAVLAGVVFLNYEHRWIQDDAYISFRYAKNWVDGRGIVFNIGERLEGYTNFLWMAVSALPLAFGVADPVNFMHGLGATLTFLTYLSFVRALWSAFAANLVLVIAGMAPLLFFSSYQLWFLSGMETALVSFLVGLAVLDFALPLSFKYHAPLLGFTCAALILTRMDQIFVVAALLSLDVVRRRTSARSLPYLALPLAYCQAVVLPYLLWKTLYYGNIFPNSYYIKMADQTFYERGWTYFRTFLDVYPVAVSAAVVLPATVFAQSERARWFFICVLSIFVGHSFYTVRLGGDFMEWRFLVPVAGPLIVATGPALWTLLRLPAAVRMAATIGCVTAFSFLMQRGNEVARKLVMPAQHTIESLARYSSDEFDWRLMGRVIKEELPEGTKVATSAAGMLPFYCDCYVLDMHGLNDPQARDEVATMTSRGPVGHEYALLDPDRLRERGAQAVIHWPDLAFTRTPNALDFEPANSLEKVSIGVGEGRYLNVLLLDPVLAKTLRTNPSGLMTFYGSVRKGPG